MSKFTDIAGYVIVFIGLITALAGGYATYVGSHVEIERCLEQGCNQSVEIYPWWFILFPLTFGALIVLVGLILIDLNLQIEFLEMNARLKDE